MGLFHTKNASESAPATEGRRQSVRGLQERAFHTWVDNSSKAEPKEPRKGSFAAERAARAAAREAAGQGLVMRT